MGERRLTGRPRGRETTDDIAVDELIGRGAPDTGRPITQPLANRRETALHRKKIPTLINMPPDVLAWLDDHLAAQGIEKGRSPWVVKAIEEKLKRETKKT